MRRVSSRFILCLFGFAALTAGTVSASADQVARDAAVRLLRQTVHTQRDGSHLAKLFALRQLGDPTLRPLFEQIVDHGEWQVQVHGVLGLAEVSPDRRLDPRLVSRTAAAAAHDAIVASAIDLELIGPEEMAQLLDLAELSPAARVMLYAERTLQGNPPEVESLERFADHDRIQVAALASVLLKQRGRGYALTALQTRLGEEPAARRDQLRLWLLESIRQYELDALFDWARAIAWDDEQRSELIDAAVWTCLHLRPEESFALWRHRIDQIESRARQVYYILMLLAAAGESLNEEWVAAFPSNGDLLNQLARLGRAKALNTDRVTPMIALIDIGHGRTNEWLMAEASRLSAEEAERLYAHIIESIGRPGGMRPDRIALAIEAAARLFTVNPDRIETMIRDEQATEDMRYVMLLGLLETTEERAGRIAAEIVQPGFSRTDSLTLLLVAKHADELTEAQLRRLGMIVAGGGRVSEMVRVQSAWLYLKHQRRIDETLPAIFLP
ncbi:MAG: hypothetical protein EA377_11720 [Phycisphaerales bacterium]|nr:MAG: hypothetical protein EA377_11720 [Phycisphaerales bacterium]